MANVNRSVWELQEILRVLGAPITVDKQYGPVTERTWSLLASRLGLDPFIKQLTPAVAQINEAAYLKLLNEYILRRAPKPGGANDFERLNNAIVLLDRQQPKNEKAQALARDWDRIASSPAWRSFVGALPPVWAGSLLLHWDRYLNVWMALPSTEEKVQLVHPAAIEPGGYFSANAWKDLWDPALDVAIQQGKTIAQAVGKELATGAAEETRKQTYEWAYSLAGLALGAAGVWWLSRQQRLKRAA